MVLFLWYFFWNEYFSSRLNLQKYVEIKSHVKSLFEKDFTEYAMDENFLQFV